MYNYERKVILKTHTSFIFSPEAGVLKQFSSLLIKNITCA